MADYEVQHSGKFAVIDTDIKNTDSYLFDDLNGRQGDEGRRVYLQIRDNGFPHDLTGETVLLYGKDVKGVTKTTDLMEHVFSPKAGTLSFLIPGVFYQAAGPYQNAYFVIKKTGTDQVVSTIPVSFTVMENAVFMTTGESVPYLANVDGKIADVAKRVDSVTTAFNETLNTINDSATAVANQVTQYMKQLKDNQVATLGGANNFTSTNHFANLIVDNWSGSAVDGLKSYVTDQVRAGIGNIKIPTPFSGTAGSRSITVSNGATTSSASDSLYAWKEDYGNGYWKIFGVGKVHVISLTQGGHFNIQLPWDVNDGDFIIGESFTDYMSKAEILNNHIEFYMYAGDYSNQEVWIDFTVAHTPS